MTRRTFASVSLLLAAAAALGAAARPAAGGGSARCAASYGYAGVVGAHAGTGVAARVSALGAPLVRWGHVAAWVGFSSPAAGSWIQAGIAGFEGGDTTLYYEVARAGAAPLYTAIRYGIAPGEAHDVAVREVAGSPGTWRVWVDGSAASPPVALAGSHDTWRPMVMAESWNGGTGACNAFRFAFSDLRTARAQSGWRRLTAAPRRVDPGYRLVRSGGRLLASTAP